MSKYIFTVLFYVVSGIIIRIMNQKFPGAHDSGIGLGSLVALLFYVAIVVLLVINIVRYFNTKDTQFIILAGIHLIMLLLSSRLVNWVINGF